MAEAEFNDGDFGRIAEVVTDATGRRWRIATVAVVTGGIQPARLLRGVGGFSVFAKKGVDANAAARFRAEVHGLRLLAESGAVRTPAVVGIVELDAPAGGAILVLEAIHTREASQADWQELGRSLAALH